MQHRGFIVCHVPSRVREVCNVRGKGCKLRLALTKPLAAGPNPQNLAPTHQCLEDAAFTAALASNNSNLREVEFQVHSDLRDAAALSLDFARSTGRSAWR